jgi:UDP-N-acetylglucosamine acyltransferase
VTVQSTSRIHPSAIIDPTALIGENVQIGPYVIIGPHCTVGDNCQLGAHTVLESHTRLGKDCRVAPHAALGGLPQDLSYKGEETWVEIGEGCEIREFVTVNRASGEGKTTVVGAGSMLMAGSHVGHNCRLAEHVILANNVALGGHVEVGEYAFIGGASVVHQFCRIGRLVIMSGFTATRQDITPFAMAHDYPAVISGINVVGLRRRGFGQETRMKLKRTYKELFAPGVNLKTAMEKVRAEMGDDPQIAELLDFIESSKRGVIGRVIDPCDTED